jgi:hypothetical protein
MAEDPIARVQCEIMEAPDDEHAQEIIRRAIDEGVCTIEDLRAMVAAQGREIRRGRVEARLVLRRQGGVASSGPTPGPTEETSHRRTPGGRRRRPLAGLPPWRRRP